jgi:hypothetical protein
MRVEREKGFRDRNFSEQMSLFYKTDKSYQLGTERDAKLDCAFAFSVGRMSWDGRYIAGPNSGRAARAAEVEPARLCVQSEGRPQRDR